MRKHMMRMPVAPRTDDDMVRMPAAPRKDDDAVLCRPNYEGDVRRFHFYYKEVRHQEFKKLHDKIRAIYGLAGHKFVMTYDDGFGDVSLAANSDVREAVDFARHTDRLLPISVRLLDDREFSPVENVDTPSDHAVREARQDIHIDVVCDGCDVSPIVGTRYWSTTRPNYDLCDTCIDNPRLAHPSLRFRPIPYPWLLEDHERIVPRPDLKRGNSGVEVLFLQKVLIDLGYLKKAVCTCGIGYFSQCTEKALKRFLEDYGIYRSSRGVVYNNRAAQKLASAVKKTRYV